MPETPPGAMSFGTVNTAMASAMSRLQISENLLPHLREQLQCVIRRDAVRKLCRAF